MNMIIDLHAVLLGTWTPSQMDDQATISWVGLIKPSFVARVPISSDKPCTAFPWQLAQVVVC
jgi:hypothetical protein